MQLVLGGAQLGQNYGYKFNKQVPYNEIKNIFQSCKKNNIRYIDTALSYKNSHKIVGNSDLKNLKIITKFKLPKQKKNVKIWLDQKLEETLYNLKKKNLESIIIHNYRDVIGKYGKIYLSFLKELKKKKIINKIGISIYETKELDLIWNILKPDLVQVPINIIDHRFIQSKWPLKLKKNKIKIYARSCFLQGLLLSNFSRIKIINNKEKKNLFNYENWCMKKKISKIKACLHFIKNYKYIDFLIVGFNSYKNLKEIIDVFKEHEIKISKFFKSNNINFIDPRKWK
jgi:aryl-alcohol dehydrogenase-like predicted oxidoreductase